MDVSWTEVCARVGIPMFFTWLAIRTWGTLIMPLPIILFMPLAVYYLVAIPTSLLAAVFPDCPYRTPEAALLHDALHLLVDLLAPYSSLVTNIQRAFPTWEARLKETLEDESLFVDILQRAARTGTEEEVATMVRSAATALRPVHAITFLHRLLIDRSGLPEGFAAFPWTAQMPDIDIQQRLESLSPLVAQTIVRMALDIVRNELKSRTTLPWPRDAPAAVAVRCAKTLLHATRLDSNTKETLRWEMRGVVTASLDPQRRREGIGAAGDAAGLHLVAPQ